MLLDLEAMPDATTAAAGVVDLLAMDDRGSELGVGANDGDARACARAHECLQSVGPGMCGPFFEAPVQAE